MPKQCGQDWLLEDKFKKKDKERIKMKTIKEWKINSLDNFSFWKHRNSQGHHGK